MNNICITGRLTKDPEMRTTQSGKEVSRFTVAVDRTVQQKGQEKVADFIDVQCWDHKAAFVTEWFGKGQWIEVTGELQTRKYTDKNGVNRTDFYIYAGRVSFCGPSARELKDRANVVEPDPVERYDPVDVSDDDLPF